MAKKEAGIALVKIIIKSRTRLYGKYRIRLRKSRSGG